MDIDASVSLAVSVISAISAVIAVLISRTTFNRQKEMQKWTLNHDLLYRSNAMLLLNPDLLRVIGIDPDNLASDGLTPHELAFINAHLHAGLAMTRVTGEKRVELTGQRKAFIRNAKVRVAWKKYLRNNTFGETPFSKAIDEYINSQEDADKS